MRSVIRAGTGLQARPWCLGIRIFLYRILPCRDVRLDAIREHGVQVMIGIILVDVIDARQIGFFHCHSL